MTVMALYHRQWGDPSHPPILMLHGHPGTAACFTPLAESLQSQFWILAPDLRGYGLSKVSAPFHMTDHLLDLETLLNQYAIDRYLLVGWSLGGTLALELALKQPQRVQGLVLMASAARPRGSHPPVTLWDTINTGLASLLNLIWPGSPWVIDTFGRHSLYRYLIQQQTPATYHFLARYGVEAYLQTSQWATQALREALKAGYNRLDAIAQLQIPSLVMTGQWDRHITCASSLETARCLPQSDWITYPHVAHLFPWEIPDQVYNDLDSWLQRQPF